jgi:hypothetical protein
MSNPSPRGGIHLLDLTAIVVGYGIAALLIRAFWPAGEPPTLAESTVIGFFYIWLGLAMSGPFVLLIHRTSGPAAADAPDQVETRARNGPRTGAEAAWLMIGGYWIVMTVLVVSFRGDRSTLLNAILKSLFPTVGAVGLLLGLYGASRRAESRPHSRGTKRAEETMRAAAQAWTHRTAVGLLLTWPIAWLALILLGKTLF